MGESGSADLFGWAREKALIFYRRSSLFFPKREEIPTRMDGRMDGRMDLMRAREIHEGRAGAWPRLAQLVDGEQGLRIFRN